MSFDPDDIDVNPSKNESLAEVLERGVSRRTFLRGSLSVGALKVLTGGGALVAAACGDNEVPEEPPPPPPPPPPGPTRPGALGFTAVPRSLADTVTVPAGYSITVLYSLGDPIAAGVAPYTNLGTDDPATYDRRAGDHHDGMHFFGLGPDASPYAPQAVDRGLLCLNHEAITPLFLHPTGPTPATGNRTDAGEILREAYLHGVSIIEVRRTGGQWSYVQGSPYNRRIHTLTEMEISGPLRGKDPMKTKFSPTGERVRGTVNNCANGWTPWGTYLTCEENWAGYFRRTTATDNPNRSPKELTALARYGVAGGGRERWATFTPDTADNLYGRWIAEVVPGGSATTDYRNAANTYGWVVEIDPYSPTSTPKKRTALGRFAHEGAVFAKAVAGQPVVVYSGDDSRNEYMYKFVSQQLWSPSDANATQRMAIGDKYLDAGTLYVAKFNSDGTGQWIPLLFGQNGITASNPAYSFADQADVDLHTRLAADAVGATKMDRPEWAAVDPITGAVYLTLTNNNATLRSLVATEPANPRHYNDVKAGANQYGNPNGHIVRWKEETPSSTTFKWDIYLFGAGADLDATHVNLSGLDETNDFSSPDGLWFSEATNVLWIQTDDGAYTDVTNCMLLAALPGQVGDGAAKTITNVDQSGATKEVTTFPGAKPGVKLKRFLVGPVQCEITGLAENGDGTALFLNIQHPGEDTQLANLATPASTWPASTAGARPRSATLVVTKNDGGKIGL
jgi:hypothetical protein